MWALLRSGLPARSGLCIKAAAAKQGSKGDPDAGAGHIPPPPPTVEPKAAQPKREKVRQAFRQAKKTAEARLAEAEQARAEQEAASAGHVVYLDAEQLKAKAAAVKASQASSSQQWLTDVTQPLTNIIPNLFRRQPRSRSRHAASSNSSRSTSSKQLPSSIPKLLLVDFMNLLYQHPSTVQIKEQTCSLDSARQHLYTLLHEYALQEGVHVLLADEGRGLMPGPNRPRWHRSQVRDRVTTISEAGLDADTVIRDLIQELLDGEAAARAAGHLGVRSQLLCTVMVHSNDREVVAGVSAAAMAAQDEQLGHVFQVKTFSNTTLSRALQLVEARLDSRNASSRQQQQQWGAAQSHLPDPQHNTYAWAKQVLARAGVSAPRGAASSTGSSSSSMDSSGEEDSSGDSSSSKRRRRRKRTTQQEEVEQQALLLAAGLSDEELLQLSAGAFVAGAAAVSLPGSPAAAAAAATTSSSEVASGQQGEGDRSDAAAGPGQTPTAAAAAAAPPAVAAAADAAEPLTPLSASQQLDDILTVDMDSLLSDLNLG